MPPVCQKLRLRARKLVLMSTLIVHYEYGCYMKWLPHMYQNSIMFLKNRGRLVKTKCRWKLN